MLTVSNNTGIITGQYGDSTGTEQYGSNTGTE